MQIKKIELGILLIISVVVIADGISLVNLDRMRAGESGTYVILLGILLLILAGLYMLKDIPSEWEKQPGGRQVAEAICLLAGYAFVMPYLGYLISTFLVTIAYMVHMSGYRWVPSLAFAIVFSVSTAWFWAWLVVLVPQGFFPWPEV